MKLTFDNPAGVAAPFADRFSHVARVDLPGGALLTLSGQVAVDDDGVVVAPGEVAPQAERILHLVSDLLAAHGATLRDVLHLRTFMLDLGDLPAYGRVRRTFFPADPPASTTVRVSGLFLPGAVLEIETTAFSPSAPPAAGSRDRRPGTPAPR
jgi:2-iminobutanoate/2-iminopropanoate deaminase